MQVCYSIAMDEEKRIRDEIAMINDERRKLDKRAIETFDMIERQRIKKTKLFLKDREAKLMAMLVPDIIA